MERQGMEGRDGLSATTHDGQFDSNESIEWISFDGYLYELGPIMPGDVKPVHDGWYMRRYGGSWTFDYWDGEKWIRGEASVALFDAPASDQQLPWLGLARPYVPADDDRSYLWLAIVGMLLVAAAVLFYNLPGHV